jgi:hypothetical protein
MGLEEELFECSFGGSRWFRSLDNRRRVLSIVKYPKQSLPEQLIRVIRATVGVIIIIIGIIQN